MNRIASSIIICLISLTSVAQSNKTGTVHISLGGSLGFYATSFDQSYTTILGQISQTHTDGAISRTIPLDFQFGLVKPMSLGIYFEFGSYLDSSAAHSNQILAVGIAPRFYIINKDRFNWMVGPEVGVTGLKYTDVQFSTSSSNFTDSYAGLHVRLATGVSVYFGKHFGIQTQIRYGTHGMKWRDRDPENTLFNALGYDAKLTATGLQIGLGLTVRIGS